MEKKETNRYKFIEALTEKEGGPVLVRHIETQKFWVKKEYPASLEESLSILKRVEHKNLPKINEIIVENDQLFLYEEYIHGKTLSELITSSGKMAGKVILSYAQEILNGLEELHRHGLIHRDIKPSNIMLTNDELIKLIDFDAVRKVSGEKENDTIQLGTIGFAAPEQFGYAESDARSDIFSLGVLMNICSTGDFPKNKLTEDELIQEVVVKATKMDPQDRYQSTIEMKEEIGKHLKDTKEKKNSENRTIKSGSSLRKVDQVTEGNKIFINKQRHAFSIIAVFSLLKSILKHVPGFRTKEPWKIVVAAIGYFFIFRIIVETFVTKRNMEAKLSWLADSFFLFILPVLLYANFLGFHKYIPYLVSSSKIKKFMGYVFLTVLWFVLMLIYTFYLAK